MADLLTASPPFTGTDGSSVTLGLATITLASGGTLKVPAHFMVPRPADFVAPAPDTVVTAGVAFRSGPANPLRSGGSVTPGDSNQGTITVRLIKADGATKVAFPLRPGQGFRFDYIPGSVFQQAYEILGDTVGDTATFVEYL